MNSATSAMVVAGWSALVARCGTHQVRAETVRPALALRARLHFGRVAVLLPLTAVDLAAVDSPGVGPVVVTWVGVGDAAAGTGEHHRAVGQVGSHAARL